MRGAKPRRDSASAAATPPMPPPIKAMRSGRMRPSMQCNDSGYVAYGLDFQPAIHRGAAGLHARTRRQRFGTGEITAIDSVELFLLALVFEPDNHFEQAIHVGAG